MSSANFDTGSDIFGAGKNVCRGIKYVSIGACLQGKRGCSKNIFLPVSSVSWGSGIGFCIHLGKGTERGIRQSFVPADTIVLRVRSLWDKVVKFSDEGDRELAYIKEGSIHV